MGVLSWFGRKQVTKKGNEGKTFDAAGIIGLPSAADARAISLGVQNTVVIGIKCGGCEREWEDALIPKKETQVVCPSCGGTNKATLNWTSVFI